MNPQPVNILNSINDAVKLELEKNNIPEDSKFAIVTGVSNEGIKFLAAVNILNKEKFNLKIASIWEHDWDGDDTFAGKIIFTGK